MANYGVLFNNAGEVTIPSWSSGMGIFKVRVRFQSAYINQLDALLGTIDSSFSSNYLIVDGDGAWSFRMGGATQWGGVNPVMTSNVEYLITLERDVNDLITAVLTRVGVGVLATRTVTRGGLLTFTKIGSTNTDRLYFNGTIWEVELEGDTDHRHYRCSDNTDTQWIDIISGQNGTYSGGLASGSSKYTVDDYVYTDTVIPVITLLGDNPLTVIQGDTYTDPSFTATDNIDGDLFADVVVTGAVDTATIGQYIISYNVADSAGNDAIEKQRTVDVVAANGTITTAPIGLNNGQLRLNEAVTAFDVFNATTAELLVRKTGLTTDATTGSISTTDALLVVGTDYDIRVMFADGSQSIKRYTAIS